MYLTVHVLWQEGEQCYLLFGPSEKEQLPAVMLDQAKVTAQLRDSKPTGTSGPISAAASNDEGSCTSEPVCEIKRLRNTVTSQKAEIESLRAELVRIIFHTWRRRDTN